MPSGVESFLSGADSFLSSEAVLSFGCVASTMDFPPEIPLAATVDGQGLDKTTTNDETDDNGVKKIFVFRQLVQTKAGKTINLSSNQLRCESWPATGHNEPLMRCHPT